MMPGVKGRSGGARSGAGRPAKYGEPMIEKTIRLPPSWIAVLLGEFRSLQEAVQQVVKAHLDGGDEVTANLWITDADIRHKLSDHDLPTTACNVNRVKDHLRTIAAAWASASLQDAAAETLRDWCESE